MKKWLKITLPLFVGGFLCWYAYQQFTEEQFTEIKKTFLVADYFYNFSCVFRILSRHIASSSLGIDV